MSHPLPHIAFRAVLRELRALMGAISLTLALSVALAGCHKKIQKLEDPLFSGDPPLSAEFRQELHYMESSGKLPSATRLRLEQELEKAQGSFGVPQALLWCLFFQESRFDPLKNADHETGARGLGQFTRFALDEINEDTDHFDDRTSEILNYSLKPHRLPITFEYKPGRPKQPRTSYLDAPTAVTASAAYLNNRYYQLRRALERQDIAFDPQVLWLFAAAAYNKGMRGVYALLDQQRLANGDEGVTLLLHSPKLAYAALTRAEQLDRGLRQLFAPAARARYVDELAKSMENILSCAIPDRELR